MPSHADRVATAVPTPPKTIPESFVDTLADGALGVSLMRSLGGLGSRVRMPRGSVLAEIGAPLTDITLCLNGDLLVSGRIAGIDVPVEQAGRGLLIGLESACAPDPRHRLGVRVIRAAEVVVVPLVRFLRALDDDAGLGLAVFGVLARRLDGCITAIESQKYVPARIRLARYLSGVLDSGSCVLPLPKKDIAALLGMTQQSLSRLLRDLRDDGIDVQGTAIRCRDRATLRRLCDPDDLWMAQDFS